jgi:hypothetical protein
MPGVFFNRWASATGQAHTVCRAVSQFTVEFLLPTANGFDVYTSDLGHLGGTAVSQFLGFQGYIPASLLFIQTTEKQIHLVMEFFVRVRSRLLAIRALALIYHF